MGSANTSGEITLDGWSLDPLAAATPKPAKTEAHPQPAGGSYASTEDFHTAVDQVVGHGRWKPTGDYRTMQREDQLRAMGAQTVAAGHVSPHSRGGPQDPGAHDIVIANVTPAQGEAMLRKIPGVKSVRFEGASGGEGAHFHVNMMSAAGWTEDAPAPVDIDRVQVRHKDGWTLDQAPVTTKDIGWRLGPKPKPAKGPSALDKASKQLGSDIDARVAARRHASEAEMEAGEEKIYDPGPDPITGLQNKVAGAFQAVGGAFGYLGSWPGALIDTYPGHAIAGTTKNAPHHLSAPPPEPVLKRDQFGIAAPQHDISDAPGHGRVKERPTLMQQIGAFFDPVDNYDFRLPETFTGDAALMIAGTAIGGHEAATPAEMARGYERGEEISHELPPPRPPRRGEEPTATRDWSDLTSAEKRAEAAEKSRAKRNQKLGIATPDDVRRMQDQNPSPFTHPEPVEGEVTPADQSVYHGSRHEFDRFSLDRVGTGEGAQVYGHGLYFAGKRDVAEHYRTAGQPRALFAKGGMSAELHHVTNDVRDAMEKASPGFDGYEASYNIAKALENGDDFEHMSRWVRDSDWSPEKKAAWQAGLKEAQTYTVQRPPKGKLYHVEIPDDHEFLDFDRPLSEQSDHVKAALEKAGYKPPLKDVPTSGGKTLDALLGEVPHDERIALVFARSAIKAAKGRVAEGLAAFRNSSSQALSEAARQGSESLARRIEALGIDRFDITKEPTDPTGSDIYKHVGKDRYDNAAEPGTPDEQASAHLREHGIVGNRYLDQGSRSSGDGSHNYVLFDDSRAEIKAVEQKAAGGRLRIGKDNPGGDWLERKIASAEKGYNPSEPGMVAKGLSDAVTAYTPDRPMVPVDELSKLTGVNNERPEPGSPKYDNLKASAEKEGFDPDRNAILIGINHRGEAYVIEGNNRIRVARESGATHLRAEIQWRNGGERVEGPWSPENVRKMVDTPDGGVDPNEGRVGAGEYTHEEATAVEKELTGKSIGEIVEFVAKRNPDRAMGKIAEHVGRAIERLQAAGVDFRVKIVGRTGPGSAKMRDALGLQGAATQNGKPIVNISYRGADWGAGNHGLQDNTLLHEAIHAVTNMALHVGRLPQNAGTDLARTVASLDKLTNHIIKVFNERNARGEVPFHIEFVKNSDELLTYGFTHEPFQKWLETIPYASGNAWTGFVDSIRKLIGLPAQQHTALTALIRHGEALFDELNPQEVAEGFPEVTKRSVQRGDGGASTHGNFEPITPRGPLQHPMYAEENTHWSPKDTDGGKAPMPKAGGSGGGGGGKGGYGGSGYGPGDIPTPGSIEHHGPVIGGEPDPIERLDNGLYRVGGAATADKLEAKEFIEKTPKELSDPGKQAKLSAEIEKRIVDPSHEIPDDLKAAYDHFKPWRDEVVELVNWLRGRRDPTLEPFIGETGYTPRRVQGHTPSWDAATGPAPKETDVINRNRNIIPSKRNLSPSSTSLNSRTAGWMVPDWKTGELVFSREKPPEGIPGTRIATMDEIEANTNIRYYRNPLINTVDEALKLRRVARTVQVLDHVKKTLKDQGLAFHYSWKDPNGVERGPGEYNLPDGFVPITNVPQLRGWAFHPEVAEVFRDYYPPPDGELDNLLNQVNRMMIGTLFITPIPHILNVAAHAVTGRGWDWLDIPGMAKGDLAAIPKGYINGVTTALQAIHEVWTKGPLYRDMLREGAGLMYGDTQVRNFLNLMLEKAGHEITGDPQSFKEFAKEFDLKSFGIHTAQDLVRLLYDKSNKSMWLVNDMFLMQRILEVQKKGADIRKAIFETEKDIPNYRVPSRVMGSRGISEFIRNRNVVVFGRYKYGQWKALSGMFKDFVDKSSSMEERVDALGKILVTGLTMMAIFPAMDMALQGITNNHDARVRRPGPFAILDAIAQFQSGEKDWAVAGSSLVSLSPLTMEAVQAYENKDFFGRPLVQAATPLGVAVQLGEVASDPIYPLKTAEEFAKPGGGTRAVGRMFGLDIPPEGTRDKAASYRARDQKAAIRREAKDPLEQAVKGGIDKLTGGDKTEEETPPPVPGDDNERPGWTLGPIP